ncbi:MAG: AzlC family ABC transporter permease [Lachnospiraceae bacterium]|nr:AzlC family ABC transporter permease [Lachnospiraceae bacterium]
MQWIKIVLKKTFPVMTGYLVLGIGFGIVMENNGYDLPWVIAMSVFIYAGSMQYLGVSLLTGGASIIQTAIATLMVNARHLFYGISMVDKYSDAGKAKPYLIFALTDETYSLVCTGDVPEGIDSHKYNLLVSLFDHCYWVLGSIMGCLLGTVLPFDTTGIDFSMTALFVTVFVQQWMDNKKHFPAITGVAVTAICLMIFGADNFLIPSMVLITVILSLGRKFLEKGEKADA